MKLTTRDISAFLASPATKSHAVLLYGPDQGLVSERVRQLRDTLLGKAFDPLSVSEFTAEQIKSDPALLADELSAFSLIGGDRLLILRDASDSLSSSLESIFTGIGAPTAYLAVMAGDLPPRSSLRKLFEKESQLAALPCYHDDQRSLAQVIRSSFQSHGLEASPDAIGYLSTQLGNDRGITQQELEKICLYMGEERTVTLEIVQSLVNNNSELALEDISHALADGNIAALRRAYERHLQEGVAPIAMLRAVMRYLGTLQQARYLVDNGVSAEDAAKKMRIFFKYIPAFSRHLRRWRTESLYRAQSAMMQAERDLKQSDSLPGLLTGRALIRVTRMA